MKKKTIGSVTLAAVFLFAVTIFATPARFTISSFDAQTEIQLTVVDHQTDLQWLKEPSLASAYAWVDALAVCQVLDYGGHQDWRLPSLIELSSIVDESRPSGPAINTSFFSDNYAVGSFWTSTTNPVSKEQAYKLEFGDADHYGNGGVQSAAKTGSRFVTCVRIAN